MHRQCEVFRLCGRRTFADLRELLLEPGKIFKDCRRAKSARKYGREVRDFPFDRCLLLTARVEVATASLERALQLDPSIAFVVQDVMTQR
jgi:hypothetical protein